MTIEIFDDYDLQTLEPDFDAMEAQLAHFAFLPGMLDYINQYMPAWVHGPFEDEEEYFQWASKSIQNIVFLRMMNLKSKSSYDKKIRMALKLRSIGVYINDYTLSSITQYDLLNMFYGYFIGKTRFYVQPKPTSAIPKEESFYMMFTRGDSTILCVFHASPNIMKKTMQVYLDNFEYNSTVRMTSEDELAFKDAMSAWVYVASKVTGIETKNFYHEQHGPVPVNYWVVEELEKKEKKS